MSLKDSIRLIRESKGITQEELAEKLNKTRSNYAYLESRGEKLTIEQLESISVALGVDMLELLGGQPKTNSEIERLQKENEELKEDLKRERKTIDTFNKFFEQLSESPLAAGAFAISKQLSDSHQRRKEAGELPPPKEETEENSKDNKPKSGLFNF